MNHLTPTEAADSMMGLSEEQSRLSETATELEIAEALYLDQSLEKTAVMALRKWRASELGQKQIRVKGRLKSLKNELSVIKNYLRHKENEGRNIY